MVQLLVQWVKIFCEKSEVRSRKSEVKSRKSEVRSFTKNLIYP